MPKTEKVYFDFAATTPLDGRVFEAMQPYFKELYGNPSSVHSFGQEAEAAVEQARRTVADALNGTPGEIIFTACGTESDNLALRGTALAMRLERGASHLLISPVEHHAVSQTAQQLVEIYGFELEYLPVDGYGQVDPEDVQRAIRPETALVSVIYANNEIGTINPIAQIGAVCKEKEVPFHSDAVQAAAHLPMNVRSDALDLLSIGAHKFYGPKGVGALYAAGDVPILPILTGGGQEDGRRAGTHNVPYIVGLAEALRIAQQERGQHAPRLAALRDRLMDGILDSIPGSQLTGHPTQRLPNHASFVLEGVDGNTLLVMLDMAGFACSSGSACKSGSPKPSDVLLEIGLPPMWALGSLRITLGRSTTAEQVDRFLEILPGLVAQARALP